MLDSLNANVFANDFQSVFEGNQLLLLEAFHLADIYIEYRLGNDHLGNDTCFTLHIINSLLGNFIQSILQSSVCR